MSILGLGPQQHVYPVENGRQQVIREVPLLVYVVMQCGVGRGCREERIEVIPPRCTSLEAVPLPDEIQSQCILVLLRKMEDRDYFSSLIPAAAGQSSRSRSMVPSARIFLRASKVVTSAC